ncbi:MAG: 50S ribosomal protein L32 [Chloroflexi bacterium]|nr:50S ribosomal protein L32 [Chloroflexota bacterium]MBI3040589.1 50S ribosomal protein L32 [Chloroflexota bacterium]MBI3930523.1 50S ribosomal protein L32 [Chloroflexota bacterium]
MGALPKRKYAKARQGERRQHLGVSPPALEYCPQCQSPKRPHHACPTCGSYAGREVIEIKTPKKKAD